MACSNCHKETCQGNCHGKPVTQYIGDLPIDNLESIADYIIGERDIEDEQSGNTIRSFVRIPGAKIYPNGAMDNIVALEPNNLGIEIPDNQVRAAYRNRRCSWSCHIQTKTARTRRYRGR